MIDSECAEGWGVVGVPDQWWGYEQPLVTIGDIAVTSTSVITPSGTAPIGQVSFIFTDMSQTTHEIPTWAIVLTVVFALFCLLGLLFLLVKETRTRGVVQVVVQGPGLLHTVNLPVWSYEQVWDYSNRVSYARSVAAGSW